MEIIKNIVLLVFFLSWLSGMMLQQIFIRRLQMHGKLEPGDNKMSLSRSRAIFRFLFADREIDKSREFAWLCFSLRTAFVLTVVSLAALGFMTLRNM